MYCAIILFVYATSSAWSQVITDEKPSCSKEQWRCRDGTCISFYDKCDGARNCPDGSDETFALCRKVPCQANWFRCAYGACVDGPAPCDNVQDCADNSDELLRRCRNETEEVRGSFECDNGQEISASSHCDGTRDCNDGSDEILKECAGKTCASNMFRCAYGACVKPGSHCDDKQDCADGSDESDELCNRQEPAGSVTLSTVSQSNGSCVLPPYPPNGRYSVSNVPGAVPGLALYISCSPGYGLTGPEQRICVDGLWQPNVVTNHECARFCRLDKDPSVSYRCLLDTFDTGSRECNEYEPEGTVVAPTCKTTYYYFKGFLPYMHCISGQWDYVARCQAECGLVLPAQVSLVVDGRPRAEQGEWPWHAGIYRKTTAFIMQICGGSLVNSKVVISAAHCFWNDRIKKVRPSSDYAVALGKLYQPWHHNGEWGVQRSDVADIKIHPCFQGRLDSYRADIAILLLDSVIEMRPHIRPVCVDFSVNFENRQLSSGSKGKLAGWGLADARQRNPSDLENFKVVEMPYISNQECLMDAPLPFKELITEDKFCAGYSNGTAVCKGDSGNGLAFPDSEGGYLRYYLRGVVSTAPKLNPESQCANWRTTVTLISRYEKFILQYLYPNKL